MNFILLAVSTVLITVTMVHATASHGHHPRRDDVFRTRLKNLPTFKDMAEKVQSGLQPAAASITRVPLNWNKTVSPPSQCDPNNIDPKDDGLKDECFARFFLFPPECPTNKRECCPRNCGGPQRGTCTQLKKTKLCNRQYDDALGWFLRDYDSTCICKPNFSGFDCGTCAYGWTGTNCNTRAPLVIRREWQSLNKTERNRVIKTFQKLKHSTLSQYSSNMTAFDHHVAYHYWASSTPFNPDITYAHGGPGFPTWHRRYVRDLEAMFQRELNDPTFGLPYWNWGRTFDYGSSWSQKDELMKDFGGTGIPAPTKPNCDGTPIAKSGPFTPWHIVDPREAQTGVSQWDPPNALTRAMACDSKYLSSTSNVQQALAPRDFVDFEDNLEFGSSTLRVMHGGGHIWIGGWMGVLSTAANDPLFFIHHCFVDLVFEAWLQSMNLQDAINTYPDDISVTYGQAYSECAGPFYPLQPHSYWFNVSTTFGYKYDKLPHPPSSRRSQPESEAEPQPTPEAIPEPEFDEVATEEIANEPIQTLAAVEVVTPIDASANSIGSAIGIAVCAAVIAAVVIVVRCGVIQSCRRVISKTSQVNETSYLLSSGVSGLPATETSNSGPMAAVNAANVAATH